VNEPISLSIVLPAYEEAENLDCLLPQLRAIVAQLAPASEIVVVDTEQPRDATPEVCARHGVRYVPRKGGPLYGHAVRTGIAESRGERVILMDADGSHNPQFLADLWNQRTTSDLVIASRYVPGGKTENPFILIAMSYAVNLAFRIVLGLNCYDVSNSFRLYRGDDLRCLRLECDHFDIVEEILVKLMSLRPGYRLKEVPIVFEKRKAGKTKRQLLTFALGYVATLWRLHRLKRKAQQAARHRSPL
jgi:dolichol-phosphate mannosyltransferase